MKFRKILPAAAGVIALTAAIAHIKDAEESNGMNAAMSERESNKQTGGGLPSRVAVDSESGDIYHVAIAHADKLHVVQIDAYSGKVMRSIGEQIAAS